MGIFDFSKTDEFHRYEEFKQEWGSIKMDFLAIINGMDRNADYMIGKIADKYGGGEGGRTGTTASNNGIGGGNKKEESVLGKFFRKVGTGIFFLNVGIEVWDYDDGNQGLTRMISDIGASTISFAIGGISGLAFGLSYEAFMYEYIDSRIQYYSFFSGNKGLFPSDNTTVRALYIKRR
jgi:hypothetical protein